MVGARGGAKAKSAAGGGSECEKAEAAAALAHWRRRSRLRNSFSKTFAGIPAFFPACSWNLLLGWLSGFGSVKSARLTLSAGWGLGRRGFSAQRPGMD